MTIRNINSLIMLIRTMSPIVIIWPQRSQHPRQFYKYIMCDTKCMNTFYFHKVLKSNYTKTRPYDTKIQGIFKPLRGDFQRLMYK